MSKLNIFSVNDKEFGRYARVIRGFDCSELLRELRNTPLPEEGTVYIASEPKLEELRIFRDLQNVEFGGMPIEIGYCNGVNHALNALEYHRSSEVNIAVDNMILLLGSLQDVDPLTFTYDTSLVQAFLIPKNTMVEMYATTLHFAPCSVDGHGFQNAVVLPKGTNCPLQSEPDKSYEGKLLYAVNKWLIAHPDSDIGKEGAFVGLSGENITLN